MGLCRRPITINGQMPPMGWGHEVTIHHSHIHVSSDSPVPLLCDHTGRFRHHDKRHSLLARLSFPFSAPLFFSSPLPSSLPRTNPIPMLYSPSSSYTQPELWVHSLLIHQQSYLSSGTIATEQAELRTTACRKIAPLPQGSGTLCIKQHQPSSMSLLHNKSYSLLVKKKIPASVCLTVVQMEFPLLQCNQRQRMTNCICTCVALSLC